MSIGKPEGSRRPPISRHVRQDKVKMDVKETGDEDVDWIYLAHNMDNI